MKTNDKINIITKEIINMRTSITRPDAFDWTEDFDGFQKIGGFELDTLSIFSFWTLLKMKIERVYYGL